jgi:sulfide:quinone oxidoreductase
LRARHVRFVQDEVVAVDAPGHVVHTRSARLPYDHLVIALGPELAPELVPGLAEASYNLCDMNSIQQLTPLWDGSNRGRPSARP